MNVRQKRSKGFVLILAALYILAIGTFLYFLISGWGYYSLSPALRIRHPLYKLLKPSGFVGHGFGILGTFMMLLMLLYSARKRISFMRNWGALPYWLDVHIFLGIAGPLFVILHSTFKINGLVSVSFWSMIAVALSGVVGRFLYLQIPRNIKGAEMTLEEVNALKEEINHELQKYIQTNHNIKEQIKDQLLSHNQKKITIITLFGRFLRVGLLLRFRKKRLALYFSHRFNLPKDRIENLILLILQKDLLDQRIYLWKRIHRYFHYWHVFHKPFALVMFLILFVHVGIAIWLGYRWIF